MPAGDEDHPIFVKDDFHKPGDIEVSLLSDEEQKDDKIEQQGDGGVPAPDPLPATDASADPPAPPVRMRKSDMTTQAQAAPSSHKKSEMTSHARIGRSFEFEP
jgi:hypothetical protein